jgi:hypothetical protein
MDHPFLVELMWLVRDIVIFRRLLRESPLLKIVEDFFLVL